MKTEQEIYTTLIDWLNLIFPGVSVVQELQSNPQPERLDLPYISMFILSIMTKGQKNITQPYFYNDDPEDPRITINGGVQLIISFKYFGLNAKSELNRIDTENYKDNIKELLHANDLAYIKTMNGVQDISELRETVGETIAISDCMFYTTDIIEISKNYFSNSRINLNLQPSNKNFIINIGG